MTGPSYPPLIYVDPSGTRHRVNGRSSRPVVRIEHEDYTYAYGGGPRCRDCAKPWPCPAARQAAEVVCATCGGVGRVDRCEVDPSVPGCMTGCTPATGCADPRACPDCGTDQ